VEYTIKQNDILVIKREFGIEGIEYTIKDDIEKINLIKGVL